MMGELAIKSAALLSLALLVGRYLRQRPATLHLVWAAVFLGVVLLPLAAAISGKGFTILIPDNRPVVYGKDVLPKDEPAPLESKTQTGGTGGSPKAHSPLPFEMAWETAVGAVWLGGFLLLSLRAGACLVSLHALRRFGTRPVAADELSVNPRDLAARAGLKPNWELRQSVTSEPATAMTWGVFRPVVLLPEDADRWSPRRLEAVLLHEFAHVRRLDFASQLLAELACALYWFNPLVWLGARAMRAGAESAADDAVLQSGVKATDYATELLQIAADLGHRPQALSRVGVSAMTQPKIESRLQSVLSPAARHRGITSVQLLAAVAMTAFAVSALGALHFGTKPPQGARSTADSTLALSRVKQAALASLLYCQDYDGVFPYVQSSASAGPVLNPYAKDAKIFASPTPGGKIVFNRNVGGVNVKDIASPAEVPLWVETLPDNVSRRALAMVDGHALLIDPGDPKIAKALTQQFRRDPRSKPLPSGYMLKEQGTGGNIAVPVNLLSPRGH